MTQQQFADAVGVHFNAVYGWLSGRALPHGTNIVRIARALGIDRGKVDSHLPRRTRRHRRIAAAA